MEQQAAQKLALWSDDPLFAALLTAALPYEFTPLENPTAAHDAPLLLAIRQGGTRISPPPLPPATLALGDWPENAAPLVLPLRLESLTNAISRALAAGIRWIGENLTLHFHPARLRLEGREVVFLTEKESSLLLFLHNQAQNVSRETLLGEVWRYDPTVDSHTLETHLYRLRQKLEQAGGEALKILSEKDGYRLHFSPTLA